MSDYNRRDKVWRLEMHEKNITQFFKPCLSSYTERRDWKSSG